VSINFISAYKPSPFFYGAQGITNLVPSKFDVAIGGRPYLLDLASNQYQSGWEPRVRDSVDQGNIPGEATISPQGLWRRSQNNWNLGAGQRWADLDDSQYGRYYKSVGIDPFQEKGTIRLLPTGNMFQDLNPATNNATNIFMVQTETRIYWSEEDKVYYSNRISPRPPGIYQQVIGFGFTSTVTGTPAADVTGMATDGFNVFISFGASGIYKTDQSATAAASYVTSINAGVMEYVKGRLMVAGIGADKHKLWNITAAGNNPGTLFTHPNTNFSWIGFCAGPNHIYCAGYAGAHSTIYRTIVKADGTGLDVPVVAGELPHSEIVAGFGDYLGFVLIGTREGLRVATADANGNLVIGSFIRTDGPVTSFASDQRFVFFAWNNHPSGYTGTGVLDLSQFTGPNTPAFASYIYNEANNANPTNKVVDMQVMNGLLLYSIENEGIAMRQREGIVVDNGFLDTGAWVWGIPDPKILAKIDGRHALLPATDSVRIGVSADDGPFEFCGCQAGPGSAFTTFNPSQKTAFKYDLRIVLVKRGAVSFAAGSIAGLGGGSLGIFSGGSSGSQIATFDGPDASPQFHRINARAFVNPARSQVIRVPLMLHNSVLGRDGTEIDVAVSNELAHLRRLTSNAQITTFQDADQALRVLVEDVLWIPDNNRATDNKWAGTAVVTMRTID
jgi:hypothetical protein